MLAKRHYQVKKNIYIYIYLTAYIIYLYIFASCSLYIPKEQWVIKSYTVRKEQ